ncbi:hypothetical protein [Actinomyces succiniciruminis]|uniref:hypothetical protein n=1 Tax=Actinomyces succiniciruminis TaxID=1522002 RepID=UPI001B33B503|nr:hypothetical protein [Actinomyces succiniciruminis]
MKTVPAPGTAAVGVETGTVSAVGMMINRARTPIRGGGTGPSAGDPERKMVMAAIAATGVAAGTTMVAGADMAAAHVGMKGAPVRRSVRVYPSLGCRPMCFHRILRLRPGASCAHWDAQTRKTWLATW